MSNVLSQKQDEIRKFMIMLIFCMTGIVLACFQNVVRSYNSTLLALSYEYGFTSRSLLGTIYHFLDDVLPVNMMTYEKVLLFAQISTGVFFIFLLVFMYLCIRKCKFEFMKPCEYLMLFYILFTVATFSGGYNFFRVDLFMVFVSLICVLLITYNKAEWLVIPLSAIGVMFHQGYVFMFFNVSLVLLFYKFLSYDKKEKIKYGIIFGATFLIGSCLFLWFEFFSRTNGHLFYDQIVNDARNLSLNGQYHTTLLYHEVLGIDLSEVEQSFRKINFFELTFFTVFFLPYIIVTIQFFKGLLKRANTKLEWFKYFIVAIGAATMLPNFILKIDYGRWILAVITYYAIVLISLVMLQDEKVECQLLESYEKIKSKPWAFIFVAYPILFVPLWDVQITGFMQWFSY